MTRILHRFTLAIAVLAPACGGGNSSSAPPTAPTTPANVLAVAGTYPTRATLITDRNTCGSVSVQDNPTTVTHTAGATELSLVHAGSTYRGTIDTAGRFSTPAANFAFPDADYAIAIGGRFSTTGFEATVELTRRAGSTTCAYAVGWVGTKQGGPNTIPG
jgi:hypothetical protein